MNCRFTIGQVHHICYIAFVLYDNKTGSNGRLFSLAIISAPVIEAVYMQYGRLLKEADIMDGAIECWKMAGDEGKKCLTEAVE